MVNEGTRACNSLQRLENIQRTWVEILENIQQHATKKL